MIENSEKKIISKFEKKILKIEEKIETIEEKFQEKLKTANFELKIEEILNKKLEDFQSKLLKSSKSQSPNSFQKKLEEFSITQNKLQKIVIDTAEKLKKRPKTKEFPKDSFETEKFNKAIDKIGELLKNYSKAQDVLFHKFKTLEAKTKEIEEKLKISKSVPASSLLKLQRQGSFSSMDENFKISFGSEESHSNSFKNIEKLTKKKEKN